MNSVGKLQESNDRLGLASRWFQVPEETARPEGAVKAEQKEGRGRIMYLAQQMQYNRNWKEKKKRST